jgi:hypothetical protein
VDHAAKWAYVNISYRDSGKYAMNKIEWSKILQNLAHLSQIILVGAVISAYFYYLKPLDQKERLNEQIEKMTLELEDKENGVRSLSVDVERLDIQKSNIEREILKLENLEKKLKSRTAKLNTKSESLKKLSRDSELISGKNKELKSQNNLLSKRIEDAKKRLPALDNSLRELVFREYIMELRKSIPGTAVSTFFANEWAGCVLCPKPSEIMRKVKNLNLPKIILQSIEDFAHIKWLTDKDRKKFGTYIADYVKNHEDELGFNPQTAYLIDKYLKDPRRKDESVMISSLYINEAHYKEVIFMVKVEKVLTGIANEFIKKGFIKDDEVLKSTR